MERWAKIRGFQKKCFCNSWCKGSVLAQSFKMFLFVIRNQEPKERKCISFVISVGEAIFCMNLVWFRIRENATFLVYFSNRLAFCSQFSSLWNNRSSKLFVVMRVGYAPFVWKLQGRLGENILYNKNWNTKLHLCFAEC